MGEDDSELLMSSKGVVPKLGDILDLWSHCYFFVSDSALLAEINKSSIGTPTRA